MRKIRLENTIRIKIFLKVGEIKKLCTQMFNVEEKGMQGETLDNANILVAAYRQQLRTWVWILHPTISMTTYERVLVSFFFILMRKIRISASA